MRSFKTLLFGICEFFVPVHVGLVKHAEEKKNNEIKFKHKFHIFLHLAYKKKKKKWLGKWS